MLVSDLRKAIPPRVKLEVLAAQARCWGCEDILSSVADVVMVEQQLLKPFKAAYHAACVPVVCEVIEPNLVTGAAILALQAKCKVCRESLAGLAFRYDHRPALEARPLNRRKTDFIPPQHDPGFIEAIHIDCHQWRTTGRKPGAAKTVTTVGSDAHTAAKVRRLTIPRSKKWKRKIPSRPFQNRPLPRSPRKPKSRSARCTQTVRRSNISRP